MEALELELREGSLSERKLVGKSRDKKRSFIKSAVTVHDRTQFETAFDYKFKDVKKPFWLRWSTLQQFEVEAYIFFPPQMDLHDEGYDKSSFYHDLRPLTRLKEPRFSFKDFLGESQRRQVSPLVKLRSLKLRLLAPQQAFKAEAEAIDLARIFACSFSTYFLKRVTRRCKKLAELAVPQGADVAVEALRQKNYLLALQSCDPLLRRAHLLLKEWRALIADFEENLGGALSPGLARELAYVEEYCHYRFREGVAKLAAQVRKGLSCQGEPLRHELLYRLRVWARWQVLVARISGYFWVDERSTEAERERFAFHLGFLKKRMWQVLYLQIKPRSSFLLRQQLGYMLAAGLAALWAFMANVFIWLELRFSGINSVQSIEGLVGASGLLVLLAFTGAYILKDRIKEIGRLKFRSGLFGKLPDFSERVWISNAIGKAKSIGFVQEWVEFLSSEKTIPKVISNLRQDLAKGEQLELEKIVHYRKRLDLDAEKLADLQGLSFDAVRDIIRFNVRGHLAKLDDPKQEYLCLDTFGAVSSLSIPKVYYLDIILRYSYRPFAGAAPELAYDCNRLVLNKDGLVRIETV